MVNTRAKGGRVQRQSIKYYEERGWRVAKVEVGGKFVKEKDMFGLFDLVCIKGSKCLFVQVTTNRPHTHKDYHAFSLKYPIPGISIVQVVWYDRRGWKIFTYNKNKKTVKDLRK